MKTTLLSPLLLLPLPLLLLLLGCSEQTSPEPVRPHRDRPLVIASIAPLQYFVSRLSHGAVDCEVALPRGADPRSWVPDRAALQKIVSADLVLFQGAALEPWLDKVSVPRSRRAVVCTGWSRELVKIKGAVTHTHGGKSHTHDGVDPFVWLDLDLAARQAELVKAALVRLLPEKSAVFERHLVALQHGLHEERKRHAALQVPGGKLLAADRVFAYWGRSTGNAIVAIDLDDPQQRAAARQAAAGVTAKVVLCASRPGAKRQQALAELGLTAVFFDPFFTADPEAISADFLDVMTRNLERLQQALAK